MGTHDLLSKLYILIRDIQQHYISRQCRTTKHRDINIYYEPGAEINKNMYNFNKNHFQM